MVGVVVDNDYEPRDVHMVDGIHKMVAMVEVVAGGRNGDGHVRVDDASLLTYVRFFF